MAKKKWKTQNQTNSQTTRRVWIEGLLQMTIFAHGNDIYIGNTKLFSVGLDFLTFGTFIASMLLLPIFRKNTYILAKGRNSLQVDKKKSSTEFPSEGKWRTTKLVVSVQTTTCQSILNGPTPSHNSNSVHCHRSNLHQPKSLCQPSWVSLRHWSVPLWQKVAPPVTH